MPTEVQGPTKSLYTASALGVYELVAGTAVPTDTAAMAAAQTTPASVPLGRTENTIQAGYTGAARLLSAQGTLTLVAAGPISAFAHVYLDLAGRVSANAIGDPVGVALTAAAAAGDQIEVFPFRNAPWLSRTQQFEVFDDFFGVVPASGNEQTWTATLTDSGTATIGDDTDGVLQLAASDGTVADNDEAYLGTTNKVFKIEANKPHYAECRIKLGAADTGDVANIIFGFCSTIAANALLDDGGGPPASYSGVVMFKVDGGTAWQAEASVGSTQTTIALTSPGRPSTAWQKLGILVVPTSSTAATAYVYVDGVLVGSQSFTFTSFAACHLMVGAKNGNGSINTTPNIDYLWGRKARA